MKKQTAGIHHITAIVGHPQENVDFYASVLGLRLVKKTINFDDPGTYHLYFGDDGGRPGTIITFFPWANGRKGKLGGGQVGVTSYAIPVGALEFWEKRLLQFDIPFEKMERFNEVTLQFTDPHGLQIELVEREAGEPNEWAFSGVDKKVAIKGFAGATLYSTNPEETAKSLTDVMGLTYKEREEDYMRFISSAPIGNVVDIKMVEDKLGEMGVGTVHHIAWRTPDEEDQLEWQNYAQEKGFHVTEVRDRNYFTAIYFREKGDILYEIATDTPGFAHDESYETMGQALKLPEQYEENRDKLKELLIPIEVRDIIK